MRNSRDNMSALIAILPAAPAAAVAPVVAVPAAVADPNVIGGGGAAEGHAARTAGDAAQPKDSSAA